MTHLGSYEEAIRTLMEFEDNVAIEGGSDDIRTSVLLGIRGCIEKLMALQKRERARFEKEMEPKQQGEVDEPGTAGY